MLPTDPAFAEHFRAVRDSWLMGRIVQTFRNNNPEGIFLYTTGPDSYRHILWLYNNPNGAVPGQRAIQRDQWEQLQTQPEILKKLNAILIECLQKAEQWYQWKQQPPGFVIENPTRGWGMARGDAMGINVNVLELRHLAAIVQTNDPNKLKRQQTHLAASVVHEMVHRERNSAEGDLDGMAQTIQGEIPSHVAQFLFAPETNMRFRSQLEVAYKNIAQRRESTEAEKIGLYDKAQYSALIIVAEILSRSNARVADALRTDSDLHKLNALRQLPDLVDNEEASQLTQALMPEMLSEEGDALLARARTAERQLGVEQSVLDMA